MELVVVERRLDEPCSPEELASMSCAASPCFVLNQVRPLRSYFSNDRRRLICLYEAPDAESVRQANRQAGLPFEVVWSAELFEPGAHGLPVK